MNPINFDQIAFGNPSARDQEIIMTQGYLDKLLPTLMKITPPANSSDATRSELKHLIGKVNSKREAKNNLYDEQLLAMIKKLFIDAGAEEEFVTTISEGIAEDVIPVITKLKYFFNRPRPSQLSYYYDMNFFPDFSYFTNNPSYPSGHVCLTAITAEVLGNLFPTAYQKAIDLVREVRESRLYLGVHYPSDNDMAMVVAREVVSDAEFKINYRL